MPPQAQPTAFRGEYRCLQPSPSPRNTFVTFSTELICRGLTVSATNRVLDQSPSRRQPRDRNLPHKRSETKKSPTDRSPVRGNGLPMDRNLRRIHIHSTHGARSWRIAGNGPLFFQHWRFPANLDSPSRQGAIARHRRASTTHPTATRLMTRVAGSGTVVIVIPEPTARIGSVARKSPVML